MKCAVDTCGEKAKYKIGFVAYPLNRAHHPKNAIRGSFHNFVCESHKDKLTPSDLFNESGWNSIQLAFTKRGFSLLDRQSVQLVYTDESEHLG
jgi:hypothetical protein